METLKAVLTSKLFWGFLIGFAMFAVAWWHLVKAKLELKRLKNHLSDKLELEAEKLSEMKTEIGNLKNENENLRMKNVSNRSHSEKADLERNLEVYARAEKTMMINAPGFAPAWESAKDKAIEEMDAEEKGKNAPRKIFKKLFKGSGANGEVIEALPDKTTTFTDEKVADAAERTS